MVFFFLSILWISVLWKRELRVVFRLAHHANREDRRQISEDISSEAQNLTTKFIYLSRFPRKLADFPLFFLNLTDELCDGIMKVLVVECMNTWRLKNRWKAESSLNRCWKEQKRDRIYTTHHSIYIWRRKSVTSRHFLVFCFTQSRSQRNHWW